MKAAWKSLRLVVSVLVLGVVLVGCASGPRNPSPELVHRIEAARTLADHEALVATYEREATTARAKAAEHRKMAQSYKGVSTIGKGFGANMPVHCNSLVNQYESIATEYDGLTADRRTMVAAAQP